MLKVSVQAGLSSIWWAFFSLATRSGELGKSLFTAPSLCPTLCVVGTDKGGTAIRRRMDVRQAAEALGISSEGVRQRIRRGSLESARFNGVVAYGS
jgi:hypothetical protein